jgi:hypothetical protein
MKELVNKSLELIQKSVKVVNIYKSRFDDIKCCNNCKYKRRGQIAFFRPVCGCANHNRMYKQHMNIILDPNGEPSTTQFCMYWQPNYTAKMQGASIYSKKLRGNAIIAPSKNK